MSATTHIWQVVIITSAASGIGFGTTQALLDHGYSVIANSLTINELEDLNHFLILSSNKVFYRGDTRSQPYLRRLRPKYRRYHRPIGSPVGLWLSDFCEMHPKEADAAISSQESAAHGSARKRALNK